MKEVWQDITGYEGIYQVSTLGRVRSLDRWSVREGDGTRRFLKGRVLSPGRSHSADKGYPLVHLSKSGKVKSYTIHSLVLTTFVGPCPEGMECRHLDGDELNCRLDNLCWGTPTQNQRDRRRHGTGNNGERNRAAKVDDQSVRQVRRLASLGMARPRIAKRLRISYGIVSDIVAGRTWTHL